MTKDLCEKRLIMRTAGQDHRTMNAVRQHLGFFLREQSGRSPKRNGNSNSNMLAIVHVADGPYRRTCQNAPYYCANEQNANAKTRSSSVIFNERASRCRKKDDSERSKKKRKSVGNSLPVCQELKVTHYEYDENPLTSHYSSVTLRRSR